MQQIGRYQVEGELGRGAMGVVYLAFDPAIGRRVAVKTIRLDQLADDTGRERLQERLLREAQSAGILSHPNIVTIYDIFQEAGNAYIFMEFVDGKTLENLQGGLPIGDLLHILEQTADGLDYAHSRGIVHRDIKPGNIMISAGQAKITDFGVARFRHKDSMQTGSLMGTPSYMSPEQVTGGETTGASDQYSLAVIAYQFLAGVKPFESENLATLLFRITQEEAPRAANLSDAANRVLQKALSKHPQLRYLTCMELVLALREALGEDLAQPLGRRTPVREPSGDEPTIAEFNPPPIPQASPPPQVTLRPQEIPQREIPQREIPQREIPQRELPQRPVPSRWRAVGGALFGATLVIAALWLAFGPRRSSPETPAVEQNAASPNAAPDGSLKPSPMGERVPQPTSEATAEAVKVDAKPNNETNQKGSDPLASSALTTAPQVTASQATVSQSPPGAHAVNFSSAPDGAEIFVQSADAAKQIDRCSQAPCVLELPAGDYRVEGRLAGFPNVTRTLRVPEVSRLRLLFEEAEGTLAVNSNPPGASLRLDGKDLPQKTPALLKLPAGKYTLEVIKDGLPSQSKEVVIRTGVVQTLSVNWN